MAGIYLHIPFCASRCVYCDFYSTTLLEQKGAYVEALCRELAQRSTFLHGEPVQTLYFGGGTPSQLEEADFETIFAALRQHFDLSALQEVTLEANPDDLTEAYVSMLRRFPFNRLSMGIQSLHDDQLRLLRRRHTAAQAIEAVARCKAAGFDNISIDLMYGLPGQTPAQWQADLQGALRLQVPHISAYHLTYEERTPLYRLWQQGKVQPVTEEVSEALFNLLADTLLAAGYRHYEISNFCLPGRQSRHNSSYWHGVPYLGCGAGAHSYNGVSRREWNVSDLAQYIKGMAEGRRDFEAETLDLPTRYNEYLLTGLRTDEGISLAVVAQEYGAGYRDYCLQMADPFVRQGTLSRQGDTLCLTRQGILTSNYIISSLMKI